jgi:hypothetical protein
MPLAMLCDKLPGDCSNNLMVLKNLPSKKVNPFKILSAKFLKDFSFGRGILSPHALQYKPVKTCVQTLHVWVCIKLIVSFFDLNFSSMNKFTHYALSKLFLFRE